MKAPHEDQLQLLKLQAIDTRLAQLGHGRKTLPQLLALDELAKEEKARLIEFQAAKDAAARERREAKVTEAEVEKLTAMMERKQAQLDSGEGLTSRDMLMMEEELEAMAARRTKLEDLQLEQMAATEEAEEQASTLAEKGEDNAQAKAGLEAERDQALAEIAEEEKHKKAEREELREAINTDLLDEYDYIRSRTGGLGAVEVQGMNVVGMSVSFSAPERSALTAAPADQVLTSDEYQWILVRTDI